MYDNKNTLYRQITEEIICHCFYQLVQDQNLIGISKKFLY